jgi:TRAP-type C4-dicarboxylate transport system permease large subunit
MLRLNYDRRFSLGIVAASSLLGMLIPPAILMIIYGVITEQSVGRLFAAGVGPGLLVTVMLCAAIFALVAARPHLGGRLLRGDAAAALAGRGGGSGSGKPHHGSPQDTAQRDAAPRGVSAGETTRQMIRPWPVYILIVLVLGGIYGGIFTPTEAGAIGAFGALVLLGMRRRFTARSSWTILLETGKATAAIFLLLITAQMYSRMLTLSGLPAEVSNWAVNLDIGATGVVLIFVLVLLALGTILDSVSILLLTMPIMYPVTQTLGLDPIWFGIVAIIAIEIGLLTPPFGMVIFAMKAALPRDVAIEDIYAGTAPFLVVLLLALALTIAAPAITLWLPTAIYG